MSVERVKRKSGVVWRVRWRDNGQPRSRVLGSKRDAEAFEAEIRRRKRMGQLAQMDAGRETVAEFAREWGSPRVIVGEVRRSSVRVGA